jgi:hypothetical protein
MLSKHYFVALNIDDPDEYLQPGDARYILNLIPKGEGASETPSKETMRGTTNVALPFDKTWRIYKCIGTTYDGKNDRLIIFLCDASVGAFRPDHHILSWKEGDDTLTDLCSLTIFNFKEAYPIINAEVIDGKYLYWTDGYNPPRFLDISDTSNNCGYGIDDIKYVNMINLHRTAPIFAPTATGGKDGTGVNLISENNFQFAYRYIYVDGAVSPFSPLSELKQAYRVPSTFNPSIYDSMYNNYYTIDAGIYYKHLYKQVKKVEFAYRIGNYGAYNIFDTKDISLDTSLVSSGSADYYYHINTIFKNTSVEYSVPDEEAYKPFENVPTKSDALAFVKNRLLINESSNGFDFTNYEVSLTATTKNIVLYYGSDPLPPMFFKQGGMYTVGIQYFDEFGKKSAVKSKVDISIPRVGAMNQYYPFINPYFNKTINIKINGQFPSWAKYFQFVRTKEQITDNYAQFATRFFFYISELNSEDMPHNWSAEDKNKWAPIVFNEKVYRRDIPYNDTHPFNYLHLQFPKNLPIQIDNSYYIRFLHNYGSISKDQTFRVVDVVGDKMVLKPLPGITDYTGTPGLALGQNGTAIIEAFKPKIDKESDTFYECSNVYPTSGTIDSGGYDMWGDTFYVVTDDLQNTGNHIKELKHVYDPLTKDPNAPPKGSAQVTAQGFMEYYLFDSVNDYGLDEVPYRIESPTPCFTAQSSSTIIDKTTSRSEKAQAKRTWFGTFFGLFYDGSSPSKREYTKTIIERQFVSNPGFVLDYSKDDESAGRFNTINSDEKKYENPANLMFSNQYVSNSLLNGLASFDVTNRYQIPSERGPIVSLQTADDMLMAIHPRNITSLYVGEAYLKQADNTDVLTKTESLIGAQRVLGGNMGTVFPESIISQTFIDPETNAKSTRVYGFDIYAGEPWRASNNGLIGLASRYKMKKWFRDKSNEYIPYLEEHRDKIKIVSGYDPYMDIYFITFPDFVITGQVDIEGITVGFSERTKRWIGFYSFVPEQYATIHNKMISFKDANMYIHNDSGIYNEFYSTTYPSIATFLCTTNYPKDKVFRSITLEANRGIYMDFDTPSGQTSYLREADFKKKGDNYVADLYKDKNSYMSDPNKNPMLFGKEMSGKSLEVSLTIPAENGLTQVQSVDVSFVEVSGNINV